MADGAIQTPELLPRQVISALAFNCDPGQLGTLSPRVEPGPRGWSLIWRDTRSGQAATAAIRDALDLRDSDLRRVAAEQRNAAETRPLGNEMIRYLVWRDLSNEPDAPPLAGERMVVVPDMDRADMLRLLQQLNTHATCIRAAVMEQAQGDNLTLFHLRDDSRRGSTLGAFLSAYRGLSVPVLKAYRTQQGTVFLPVNPPLESLAGVARLIHDAPGIFGRLAAPRQGWMPEALLFAISRAGDAALGTRNLRETWYDIRDARFFGSAAFISENARPQVTVAAPVYVAETALRDLKARLHDPDGLFARQIGLRPSGRFDIASEDASLLAALEADRRVLERRIRAIRNANAHKSVMVVAAEADFPLLAQLLQQIVGSDEHWRDVRYTYLTRSPGQPEDPERARPTHVFHFGPEAAEAVGLHAARAAYTSLDFYWSDPGWASSYGTLGRIEMMVPWGQRIMPFPHSWEAEEMDAHLRDMVSVWSDGRIALSDNERHVVQFVADAPTARNDAGLSPQTLLRLEVFRASDLYPLTGKTLTWFNAVLAQTGAFDGDTLRTDLETTEGRAAIAEARAKREAALGAEAQAAANAAEAQIDAAWEGFAEALQSDLDTRMTVLAARAEDISEIEERTKELETLLSETKTEFDAMQRDAASFARRASATPQRQSAEMTAFLRELADRNTKFTEMSASAEARLNLMRATLDRVKRSWFG